MKSLTVMMEKVILNGEGRESLTCFVYQVYEINNKYFFLVEVLFRRRWSEIWTNTFFLGRHVLFGDHLRLELSCIWVNAVVWNGNGRQNTIWQVQTPEIQVIKNRMQW